jgi:hypothetical protein
MRRTSRRKAGNGFMELDGYRATSAVAGVSSTTASHATTITSLAGVGLGVAEGVSIKRFGSMASLPVRANDIKVRLIDYVHNLKALVYQQCNQPHGLSAVLADGWLIDLP